MPTFSPLSPHANQFQTVMEPRYRETHHRRRKSGGKNGGRKGKHREPTTPYYRPPSHLRAEKQLGSYSQGESLKQFPKPEFALIETGGRHASNSGSTGQNNKTNSQEPQRRFMQSFRNKAIVRCLFFRRGWEGAGRGRIFHLHPRG